jgi:hypothetical protein
MDLGRLSQVGLFYKHLWNQMYNICIVASKNNIEIMETLYFILGALSVVVLIAVVGVFRIKSELKEFTNDEISRMNDSIGQALHGLEENLYRKIEGIERDNEQNSTEVYRYIDSRVDKQASAVSKHLADINTQLGGKL